jgi:hypothetical protein
MAKNIVKKSRAKALDSTSPSIGDNSLSAAAKKTITAIEKLGSEARALSENFKKESGKKMVEAALLYQEAARSGDLSDKDAQMVADKYAGTTATKQLVNDLKSFALPHVVKAANYKLVSGAVPGKSHFQAMMAVNRALTRFTKDKATKDKALPTVNEAFVKKALAYKKDEPEAANPKTADGKKRLAKAAFARAKALAADITKAVLAGAALNGATPAQIRALTAFVENFAKA